MSLVYVAMSESEKANQSVMISKFSNIRMIIKASRTIISKLLMTYYIQGIKLGMMRNTYSVGLELHFAFKKLTTLGRRETVYTSN